MSTMNLQALMLLSPPEGEPLLTKDRASQWLQEGAPSLMHLVARGMGSDGLTDASRDAFSLLAADVRTLHEACTAVVVSGEPIRLRSEPVDGLDGPGYTLALARIVAAWPHDGAGLAGHAWEILRRALVARLESCQVSGAPTEVAEPQAERPVREAPRVETALLLRTPTVRGREEATRYLRGPFAHLLGAACDLAASGSYLDSSLLNDLQTIAELLAQAIDEDVPVRTQLASDTANVAASLSRSIIELGDKLDKDGWFKNDDGIAGAALSTTIPTLEAALAAGASDVSATRARG